MGGFSWVMCGSNKEEITLKLRKSGEKVSDVVFPLYLYVRNITVSCFKSVLHLGLHGDFSCLQICFCFVLFCFVLLDVKMLNKLYIFFICCLCLSGIALNSSYSIMTNCSYSIFNKIQVPLWFPD